MNRCETAGERLAKGIALLEAGSVEAALTEIRAALAISPESPYAHLMHGVALRRLGRLHQAMDAYDEAAMVEDANWHVERAACLSMMGRDTEALRAADAALALAPEDGFVWYRKGAALARAARSNGFRADPRLEKLAEAALRRAIELDPHTYSARLDLAELYLRQRPEEAEQLLTEALAIRFGEPRIHYLAAEAALRAGRLDAAFSHIRIVIGARPDSPQALALLVRIRNARAICIYNALQKLGWKLIRRRGIIYATGAALGLAAFLAGMTRTQLWLAVGLLATAWLIWAAVSHQQVKRQLRKPTLSPDF